MTYLGLKYVPVCFTASVPPFKKGTVEDLQNLLEKVKTYKVRLKGSFSVRLK